MEDLSAKSRFAMPGELPRCPAAWQGAIMGDLDAAILLRRNYDVAPTELDIASINGLVASISSLIASKRYRRN
jgi:hypothetical protein